LDIPVALYPLVRDAIVSPLRPQAAAYRHSLQKSTKKRTDRTTDRAHLFIEGALLA
jgi:hypothetical protein